MSRQEIRDWKRVLRQAQDEQAAGGEQSGQDAALSLLARSIRFRHARLAILRFADAVAVGARPAPEHWRYCRDVALASKDPALQMIYRRAAEKASALQAGSLGLGQT